MKSHPSSPAMKPRGGAMGVKRKREESGRLQRISSFLVLGCLSSCSSPTTAFVVSQRPSLLTSPRLPGDGCLQYSLGVERPLVTTIELETLKSHIHPLRRHDRRLVPSPQPLPSLGQDQGHDDKLQNQQSTSANLVSSSMKSSPMKQHSSPIQQRSSSSPSSKTNSILQLWKRRLVTREDWKHTHKITGMLFLLSSWGLTAYALRDLLGNGWTIPVTRHGKPFCVLLWTLISSSVLQSFSSISMACKYRRGQPAVRNTFLCNAAVAILGSVSALWTSAWYPAGWNGLVSKAFYLIMDAIGLIGMGDNLVRLQALIASRQVRKHSNTAVQTTAWQYWKDVFVYMMPILIGAPFFVAIGWQFGIQQDRLFYLNLLQQPGHLHLKGGAVYAMIMVAMGASYSSLIVTLRDKKLIGKRTEGMSLTAVMLCLIGSLYQAMRDPGTIAAIMGM